MRKVKVLFFAADPLSADYGEQRLLLDTEVRQTRERVEQAAHHDALEFEHHWAVRTDDLLRALRNKRPQVVHFSGHGQTDGLVFVRADGIGPHLVPAAALVRLFKHFRGDIRLVVLNACFSRPQAKAIAQVVGCAIGTRRRISDGGAITFSSSFYRAIASGASVKAAFVEAQVALGMEHPGEEDCPVLVPGTDIDPSQLVLIPATKEDESESTATGAAPLLPGSSAPLGTGEQASSPGIRPVRALRRAPVAITALVVSGAAIAGVTLFPKVIYPPPVPVECEPRATALSLAGPIAVPAPASTAAGDEEGVAAVLADAKELCRVGNHAAAFARFKQAADAGNPEAIGYLGLTYLRGAGTARDTVEGIRLLRKAAADGRDPHAMNALGVAYQTGDGVDRSERWARHWFKAAADEKAYAESMRNLGGLAREDGDDPLALTWYKKAVDSGSVEARVDIGLMYEAGRVKDGIIADAGRWYRSAARRGSARGMFALGRIYQEGLGIRQDYNKARSWYLKAAERGSADAMNNLGLLYRNGWGVEPDQTEAIRWFRLAAAAGSTLAFANLEAMGERP